MMGRLGHWEARTMVGANSAVADTRTQEVAAKRGDLVDGESTECAELQGVRRKSVGS